MHPIDKTRSMYLKEFYIIVKNGAPKRKTRKVCSGSPQWDGFLKVLSVSDIKFLSLIMVENLDKHRTQWEFTKKKWKTVTKNRSSVI